MIIRSDVFEGIQVQFTLNGFDFNFFGTYCRRTDRADGFILEVHASQREKFEESFQRWFISQFDRYLFLKESVDKLFKELRHRRLDETDLFRPILEAAAPVMPGTDEKSGKRSVSFSNILFGGVMLAGIAAGMMMAKAPSDAPRIEMRMCYDVYHDMVNLPRGNIKVTFTGIGGVFHAEKVEMAAIENTDYELIINSVNMTQKYLRAKGPVYQRYQRILQEFHHVQRACQRITGQRVIDFELGIDRKVVNRDEETKNLGLALEYFKRSIQNILDNPKFSETEHKEVLGIRIIPTCVERDKGKGTYLYVFSRTRVDLLLKRINTELEEMSMAVEREISTLRTSISNVVSRNEILASDPRYKEFVRPVDRKERWYLLCVVALLIAYAYSPILGCLFLGLLLWLLFTGETPDNTQAMSEQGSLESLITRYRGLHEQSDRKARLEKLREQIENFLRMNPHCFCVGLERPCTGIEEYKIANIGDFEEY